MTGSDRLGRSLPLAIVAAGALAFAACAPPKQSAPPPSSPTLTTTTTTTTTAPPPEPAACQGAAATGTAAGGGPPPATDGAPVTPAEAAARAREAAASSTVRTSEGAIPIVTVERTPAGLQIDATPVADADEAAALAAEIAAAGALVAVEVDTPVAALDHLPADDEFRNQQWALDQVAFEHAWLDGGTRGSGVRVAVIDTGVKGDHEDLVGRVDPGFFFLSSNDGQTQFEGPGADSDSDGHGTHVAGIAAAEADNEKGIAGAAPEVQIVPVQVLCPGPNGGGRSVDVAKGIAWAADPDRGNADVLNLSLGGNKSEAVRVALEYAMEQGVIVVAAAGNTSSPCSPLCYPAAFSMEDDGVETIAVAATTNSDPAGNACYSIVADYIDLAAPGGSGSEPCEPLLGNVLSTWSTGGYAFLAGTSMAAPHVAAAAALLVAKGCSAAQAHSALLDTAQDLGLPDHFGAGLVDPEAAVAACP